MGQLRSSLDLFKADIRVWLAKVKARGQADIYQPLLGAKGPAEEFAAFKLFADYQERVHELNQLIGWLEQAVTVAQKSLGAVAVQRSGANSGRSFRLIPVRIDDSAPPLGTPDAPLEFRHQTYESRSGSVAQVRVVVPWSLATAGGPDYKALLADLARRASEAARVRQKAAPPEPRKSVWTGPAVTLD